MAWIEQNTRFDHTSPYLNRPLSQANFGNTKQWTAVNHYRTSYRDMSIKVSLTRARKNFESNQRH